MSTTRSPAEFAALIEKLSAFVESEVIPAEDLRKAHDAQAVDQSVQALRQRAVAQGLGNPRRPVSEGGLGLSWEECCSYLEQAGRSFLGPGALQCAAPGQPDIAALDILANSQQRQRYRRPRHQQRPGGRPRRIWLRRHPQGGLDPTNRQPPTAKHQPPFIPPRHQWRSRTRSR